MGDVIRWTWLFDHAQDIGRYTVEQAQMAGIAIVIATIVAVPVGIAVRNTRLAYATATGVSGLLYTIPSLALFAFLVPIIGIGQPPVIVGLVLYSLLIMVRNTVVGLRGVPVATREAATGMGLTRRQVLTKVEIPIALPSIIAGIRIAAVSAIGIATIGVFCGAGGLGELIYNDGINRATPFLTPIIAGAAIATAMALVVDLALVGVQRALTPWSRRGTA
jgi:osmoprotectant transport system permease protein